MPLRLALFLCAALLLIVLAAGGQGAVPAGGHWQAVLAAGDRAEPVFDNAVAALSSWLASHGVLPGDIHRFSASPARAELPAEPASGQQLLRRGVFDMTVGCVRQREAAMRVLPSQPQHFYGERVRDLPVP